MAKKKEIELKEDDKDDDIDDFNDPEKYYQEENFDFCRKQVFLTFPQTKLTIDDLKWWFEGSSNGKSHYPKIKEACYTCEHHKDKNLHWHVYIGFSKKIHTKNFNYFDCCSEDRKTIEHPHIKRVYNKYGLIDYMTKENFKIYTTNLDLDKYKAAVLGKKKYDYFYEKIMKNEMTVKEVVDQRPGLFPNIRKLMDAKVAYDSLKDSETKKDKYTMDYNGLKKRHWWIYGISDSGKTYFLKNKWTKYYPSDSFQVSYDNNFYGYVTQRILWFDEFEGQYNIHFLNRLCDGEAKVRVKYGEAKINADPLVIVCSNYHPYDVYRVYIENQGKSYESLKNRFRIMYIWKDNDEKRWMYEENDKYSHLIDKPGWLKEIKGIDVNRLIELH
jgi:hypothetical protein